MLFSSFTLSNISSRRQRASYSPSCAKRPPPTDLYQSDKNPADFQGKVFTLKIGNGLCGAFSPWIHTTWGETKTVTPGVCPGRE